MQFKERLVKKVQIKVKLFGHVVKVKVMVVVSLNGVKGVQGVGGLVMLVNLGSVQLIMIM